MNVLGLTSLIAVGVVIYTAFIYSTDLLTDYGLGIYLGLYSNPSNSCESKYDRDVGFLGYCRLLKISEVLQAVVYVLTRRLMSSTTGSVAASTNETSRRAASDSAS